MNRTSCHSRSLAVAVGCLLAGLGARGAESRGSQLLAWTDFKRWDSTTGPGGETVLTSPALATRLAWDEAVTSWNAETPGATGLRVDVRAWYPDHTTTWYCLGWWSASAAGFPRASVPGQKDSDGAVATDTLRLTRSVRRVQARVTLVPDGALRPTVRFFAISLLDRDASRPPLEPNRRAWGRTIEVEPLSQVDYPEGVSAWCSPTSVAMVLRYWGRRLHRPELIKDVPEVAAGVMDPKWPGTGNWSFNTAYAGSFRGIRALVTRLADVSELEAWVVAGAPPIVSLNYDTLRAKPPGRDAGHLMVVVGFTAVGDPILNDPGTRLEKQRAFGRRVFAQAWDDSQRTVYLICPETFHPPSDRFGHWAATPTRDTLKPGSSR